MFLRLFCLIGLVGCFLLNKYKSKFRKNYHIFLTIFLCLMFLFTFILVLNLSKTTPKDLIYRSNAGSNVRSSVRYTNDLFDITLNNKNITLRKTNQRISGAYNQCFYNALSQLEYGNQNLKTLHLTRKRVLNQCIDDENYKLGLMADGADVSGKASRALDREIIILSLNLDQKGDYFGFFSLYDKNGMRDTLNIRFKSEDVSIKSQQLFYDKLTDPNVYKLLLSNYHYELFEISEH